MNNEYVCGVLLSPDKKYVTMLKKNKPDFLAGKWNFPGGKINEGETPEAAVRREFLEETGVDIESWNELAIFGDLENFRIRFFYALSPNVFDVRTTTDEEIRNFSTYQILAPMYDLPVEPPCSTVLSIAITNQISKPVILDFMP